MGELWKTMGKNSKTQCSIIFYHMRPMKYIPSFGEAAVLIFGDTSLQSSGQKDEVLENPCTALRSILRNDDTLVDEPA